MPSAEGQGFARAAWDTYAAGVRKAARPFVAHYATSKVGDLIGFWVLWHTYGGFEGLLKLGMPRTTIFRKVSEFRKAFGYHPDVYVFDWIEFDMSKPTASVRQPDGSTIPAPKRAKKGAKAN